MNYQNTDINTSKYVRSYVCLSIFFAISILFISSISLYVYKDTEIDNICHLLEICIILLVPKKFLNKPEALEYFHKFWRVWTWSTCILPSYYDFVIP